MPREGKQLFLIFHGRYPSEKAASLFAAKSAESFARTGFDVTLIVPRRFGRSLQDHRSFYGLKTDFSVVYIPTIDLVPLHVLQGLAFRLSLLAFSIGCMLFLLARSRRNDIVLSNEALPLCFAALWSRNAIFEMHDYPEWAFWFYRLLFQQTRYVLVTNRWKYDRFARDFRQYLKKAFCEPNAVDLDAYALPVDRTDARTQLSLPMDARIAVYTGHLYAWKGVDTLARAAQQMPEVLVCVVGGTEDDTASFRKRWGAVENIRIVGHRPRAEMPLWQRAADVLVLPNTEKEEISSHYTSPMKLFEYMASGTPIVASDLPSIREIADGCAVFVRPDDPHALALAIREGTSAETARYAERAKRWVQDHTWNKRAARIIKRIREPDVHTV